MRVGQFFKTFYARAVRGDVGKMSATVTVKALLWSCRHCRARLDENDELCRIPRVSMSLNHTSRW